MIVAPFGDNVLYEGIREAQQEDTLIREYVDFPRSAIQITGGAQHNEALAYAARFRRETPTRRVYYRFSDDDNIHLRETPESCAARLASYAALGLIPSYNNEPTEGKLIDVVTHAMQTMRLLKARGVENCLMVNWNTGYIDDLEKLWRPELNDLYAEMRRIGYTGGFHEYMNTRFLDDPAQPLYIGRYRYVLNRFPGLKVCISEFGFDSHAPNPSLDGYKNHKAIWEILFPGKSLATVYFQEAVKADTAIYALDGIEDVLWFCRGHNLTPRWVAFNTQHDTELLNKKKVYRRTVNPMPEWKAYFFKPAQDLQPVNVRAAQSTGTTPIAAQIPVAGVEGELDVSRVKPDNVTPINWWFHVRVPNPQEVTVEGWVRSDTLVEPSPVVPDADPNPPGYLPALEFDLEGRASRADIAAWLRAIADVTEHGVISP